MKKEDFFTKLAEVLELEDQEINEGSALHLTSLMTLSLISFLDEQFGVRVKAADLQNTDSVAKLMDLIGNEKLE